MINEEMGAIGIFCGVLFRLLAMDRTNTIVDKMISKARGLQ